MSRVSRVGRTWELWAYRYESGALWHVGARRWVELHRLDHPLVPVLVEEILGDLYAPEISHYSWQYPEGSRYRDSDVPTMIQIRTGNDPKDPKRALMFLSMCFPYGLDSELEHGDGSIVALRITEAPHETTRGDPVASPLQPETSLARKSLKGEPDAQ